MSRKQSRKSGTESGRSEHHQYPLRLPLELHEAAVRTAKAKRLSLNSAVLFALEDWIDKEENMRERGYDLPRRAGRPKVAQQ